LKQAQLFEAVSGPCPIAILHLWWTHRRLSNGTGYFSKMGLRWG